MKSTGSKTDLTNVLIFSAMCLDSIRISKRLHETLGVTYNRFVAIPEFFHRAYRWLREYDLAVKLLPKFHH